MAQPDSLAGQQIGNFLVRRHLARGGMADVYLAENVRLRREVALKVLLPSFVENAAFVERFRREAQAMARLQHSNIVQVYDTGDTPDGRPFIAMQYVAGGTLEGLLDDLEGRGQVMTVAFGLALARQVADALATAHRAGIIHRDLKPSNILLDDQRRPLLTDLGIAYVQDTQRLTRTDTFIGTPHYMSPEQGKGLQLDARSDIYSLGVVLFEMLAGQRPFPGDSHWALIHQHVTEPAPSLAVVRAGLPRPVAALVARCLEKEPGRRFQSAGELAAAIDQALGQVGAAGATTPSGAWQWQPRQTAELFVERAGRPTTDGRGQFDAGRRDGDAAARHRRAVGRWHHRPGDDARLHAPRAGDGLCPERLAGARRGSGGAGRRRPRRLAAGAAGAGRGGVAVGHVRDLRERRGGRRAAGGDDSGAADGGHSHGPTATAAAPTRHYGRADGDG